MLSGGLVAGDVLALVNGDTLCGEPRFGDVLCGDREVGRSFGATGPDGGSGGGCDGGSG